MALSYGEFTAARRRQVQQEGRVQQQRKEEELLSQREQEQERVQGGGLVGLKKKSKSNNNNNKSKGLSMMSGLGNGTGKSTAIGKGDQRGEDVGAGGAGETVFERLGNLLQTQEVQLVMVILIVVDFFGGFYQLYAQAKGWDSAFLHILEYQSGMTTLLFGLEIGLVLLAYRGEMFSHLGYTMDLMIVASMFYGMAAAPEWALASRCLNALRLWRVARMLNGVLQAAEVEHIVTQDRLAEANEKIEALKIRAKKAELAHKRETDKNRRLEQNFRSQRDELDTMREALQIAAQTMAKVQGYEGLANLMGEDEQRALEQARLEEEQDEEEFDDAPSNPETLETDDDDDGPQDELRSADAKETQDADFAERMGAAELQDSDAKRAGKLPRDSISSSSQNNHPQHHTTTNNNNTAQEV